MNIKGELISPVTYQGGKQRIAVNIIDLIPYNEYDYFYDFCCGSGAVSIELVNRGFPVNRIFMVEAGPFGCFWKEVGDGTFSLSKFKYYCDLVPKDLSKIKLFMEELVKLFHPSYDTAYIYLLLQAAAFGGKAIWIGNNKWANTSFRNYWLPTETSNRRSPVNPMMPMPKTLYERVAAICEKMFGVGGSWIDIKEYVTNLPTRENSVVYIDPPYGKTTAYGHNFNLMELIAMIDHDTKIYVSEGAALTDKSYLISGERKKGGIAGYRTAAPNEEWLSEFNYPIKRNLL